MAVASGTIDNTTTSITSKATRDQDGNEQTDNFTVVDASFDNETRRGLSIAALTNEDVNFAPVGLGFGAVGVAGVVATTVANSTTRAKIGLTPPSMMIYQLPLMRKMCGCWLNQIRC